MHDSDTFHPFILRGHFLIWAEWEAGIWDEYIEDGERTLESIATELFDEGRFLPELEHRVGQWELWYQDIEMGLKTDAGFYEEGLAIAKAVREIIPSTIDIYYKDRDNNVIKI